MITNSKKMLLCIITALFWFSHYAYVSYMTPNLSLLGATPEFIGLISGAVGISQIFCRIPLGMISDKYQSHKVFIALGCFVNFIACTLMYFSFETWHFLVLRVLTGVGSSTWVCVTIMYNNYFEAEDGAKSIGVINVYNSLGRVFSLLFGAAISAVLDIKAPFLISAAAALIATILTLFTAEKKRVVKPVSLKELVLVASNRDILIPSYLGTAVQFVTFATAYTFISSFAPTIGASEFDIGMLTATYAAAQVVGSYLCGSKFVSKWGLRRILIISFISMTVYTTLCAITYSVLFLYIITLIGGFGLGTGLSGSMAMIPTAVPYEKKTTAMGIYQSIYSAGILGGPILTGYLVAFVGYRYMFIVLSFVSLSALFVVIKYVKKEV